MTSAQLDIQLIETKDSSHSLFSPSLGETYHSHHGAITESRYVYIEKGLVEYHSRNQLRKYRVLEIGFGTGLNALLALEWSFQKKVSVEFVTVEKYPLSERLIKVLNYPSLMGGSHERDWNAHFHQLHQVGWGESKRITEEFLLHKHKVDLLDFDDFKQCTSEVDIIFFDAFAPSKQPELWCPEVFEHLSQMSKSGAYLVTYCAQGQFRRDLRAVGFKVESLSGPPGKREMTRGILE